MKTFVHPKGDVRKRAGLRLPTLLAMAFAVGAAIFSTAVAAQSNCVLPTNAVQLEATIGAGLNQVRLAQSLGSVNENRRLTDAARIHACDMALNNYFDHRGADGSNLQVRVRNEGYQDCLVAENLAWGYPDPGTIINGWMASPGHRQNMLLQNVRDFGVGVVEGPQGPLWVLVVARPC